MGRVLMHKALSLCESWLAELVRMTFNLWQRLGFHVTLNRYHEPIPDTRQLAPSLWSEVSSLPGIQINEEKQLDLLNSFVSLFRHEYETFPRKPGADPGSFFLENTTFESVDAEILYCMIRYFKPSRVVEIGSGFSTRLTAQAIGANKAQDQNYTCAFSAIEPYPSDILKSGFPGLTKLIPEKLEAVSPEIFRELGENDILFIDSSHVLRIGGDVQYEYLEIIPRIRPGVIIHVHDIFLPAEYPNDWIMKEHRFWTEQYILQAFLAFNESFEILWAGSWMSLYHPDKLEEAFESYSRQRTWPGSFWFKRVK